VESPGKTASTIPIKVTAITALVCRPESLLVPTYTAIMIRLAIIIDATKVSQRFAEFFVSEASFPVLQDACVRELGLLSRHRNERGVRWV